MKTRNDPYFPAEVGHRCSSISHIGNIAMDLGKTLKWDPKKETFPEDWGQTTRKSRLMHGSGIRSLTSLMDEIVWANLLTEKGPEAVFKEGLEVVRPACHWSSGSWEFENGDHRKWNDIQNLGRDRELVTRHLLAEYRTQIQL